MRPGGPTPLVDAISLAIERLSTREGKGRKVVLVNSDGDDDTSRRSTAQLETVVGRSDVLIYAIGPPGIAGAAFFLGFSATMASVVKSNEATEAAF